MLVDTLSARGPSAAVDAIDSVACSSVAESIVSAVNVTPAPKAILVSPATKAAFGETPARQPARPLLPGCTVVAPETVNPRSSNEAP